ncbi:N-acetyltransferase [Streptomyces sp. SCSIO 75703]|uniref:GNAT family N-acetyltransferase n=1 Tax=unclassified Streptomyces TaxID=2593676 RepID=UPI0004C28502|nr:MULTISPECIES: N-acetyltransferase [unclassified Streptomyces]
MFRLVTEVDRTRRELLRTRLRDADTSASAALRSLRGTEQERDSPLHVWALDGTGALAGGLVGHTWATWLHVTYLWVDGRYRGAGLGSRLLAEAEHTAGAQRGCAAARVETWDFQAPGFYRAHGYRVVCEIPDYPPGITEYTLLKRLP